MRGTTFPGEGGGCPADGGAAFAESEFLVAGDGPERDVLHRRSPANVKWLGRVPDTRAVYAASDVIVIPSRQEGQGIVALEAMASGRAVVASRIGGLAEMLTDEASALLVPANDPRRWRRQWTNAGRFGPGARLAANGRTLVEAKYDIRWMVAAVEQVYQT